MKHEGKFTSKYQICMLKEYLRGENKNFIFKVTNTISDRIMFVVVILKITYKAKILITPSLRDNLYSATLLGT